MKNLMLALLFPLVALGQNPAILYNPHPVTPGTITLTVDDFPSFQALTNFTGLVTRGLTNAPVPPDPTNNPIPPTNPIPPIPTNGAVIVSTAAGLRTALAGGVGPGGTILIRGGTYPGIYESGLRGTADKPIVVRNYPGERVVIDGGNSLGKDIFLARGSYTWFWGLEVMSSSGVRYTSTSGSDPSGNEIPMGEGFTTGNDASTVVPGIKFINCRVHDVRQGFSVWMNAQNAEVYGAEIYNIGWCAPDRGHGHGIYTQNKDGVRSLVRNTSFGIMSHGIQAYGSATAPLQNIQYIQNFLADDFDRTFVIGGGQVATSPMILGNLCWTTGGAAQIGYGQPVSGCNLSSNWFIVSPSNGGSSGVALRFVGSSTFTAYRGNSFYGTIVNNPSGGSDNKTLDKVPAQVLAYPNLYEQRRGTIAVLNGGGSTSIPFLLSQFGFVAGDHYYIHDNEDYNGDAVLEGLYGGNILTIPLKTRPAVLPIGNIPADMIPKTTEPDLFLFTVTSTKY